MESHIKKFFDPIITKKLFGNALLIDIDDNNEKVDIIRQLLPPDFTELAPGTNRYAVRGPDGFCYKIALDRRGIVDNITEFRRSPSLKEWAPKAYECNGVITVAEPVQPLSRDEFIVNREGILSICEILSHEFIFEDIGFNAKNFCNWGMRHTRGMDYELVILDTGYMIPILGNEEAMKCPVCGEKLRYNNLYTGFRCSYSRCNTEFSFIDVYRRLDTRFDDEIFKAISGFELPDLNDLNNRLYNSMMKGGHIAYDGSDDDDDFEPPLQGNPVRIEDLVKLVKND